MRQRLTVIYYNITDLFILIFKFLQWSHEKEVFMFQGYILFLREFLNMNMTF